ncbi:MAG: restriction endonuclease subunit S [Phycisphaerales bacterium]|nr:restriction endonuclease subunit S [Phycisphaerales bacterium]
MGDSRSAMKETTFQALIDAGLIEIGDGYRAKNNELGGTGPLFLRAGHVSDTHISFDGVERFHSHLADAVASKMSKPGDVVITTKGNSTGRTAFITPDLPPFVYSPHLSYWRSKDHGAIVPGFLRAWSNGAEFSEQLEGMKLSTDMAPYLSLTDQRRLHITLPPPDEQRSIARVLGGLNDKIELNRRMNRTLEDLARGLFRSWFVDFDPVTKNGNGRAPATPAGLFPKRLVDSPIGPIPEGWRVSTIGQEVSVVGGSTPSTDEPKFWEGGKHCWVTPRDLSRLTDPVVIDCERRITDAGLTQISSGLMPRGTVLLSSRAPIGYLAIADVPVAVNQGFIGLKCDKGLPGVFALRWCEENMEEVLSRAGGTTFAEISKAAFRPIPMVVPTAEVIEAFARAAQGWHDQIVANVRQSRQLAALRDALLPQLLSGEIRLREAEAAVGESLRSGGTPRRGDGNTHPRTGKAAGTAKGRA